MKKLLFILPVILFACSESTDTVADTEESNQTNTTTVVDVNDPEYVNPNVVNTDIDTNTSTINWSRFKKVKNASMKLGNISMSVGEMEYTTEGDFVIESGYWQVIDGEKLMCEVIVDLTRVASIQLNDDNKLEVVSPGYLDVENYPSAMLLFKSFEINEGENEHNCTLELTLKGVTKPLDAVAVFDWSGVAPSEMACTFTVDGVEWGLVNPDVDADVEADELTITCVIKTVQQ